MFSMPKRSDIDQQSCPGDGYFGPLTPGAAGPRRGSAPFYSFFERSDIERPSWHSAREEVRVPPQRRAEFLVFWVPAFFARPREPRGTVPFESGATQGVAEGFLKPLCTFSSSFLAMESSEAERRERT